MAGYGRMEIMRMSDEEILEKLKSEGEDLPDYVAVMMLDELKRRKEEGSAEEEDAENAGGLENLEELEEDYADAEDFEDGEEDEEAEEDLDEDGEDAEELTPEEELQRRIDEAQKEMKERKRTLIIASAVAVGAAILMIGFVLYLKLSGNQ